WLYSETGTLLFYDNGAGCLEQSALTALVAKTTFAGMAVSTAIALLIFCGAVGKSGQVPLHVWLPDAMEGPTPVSALIHAATMVAAGVFLVARVYPLMAAGGADPAHVTTALQVVTWVGAITAVFAALIATAQNDIKRILAYSTVSQLGYMMMGLGVGGIAVGMFHLITHAFFKALLFLGAGSVIHGCHEEQDIRRMGGLKKFMPITFATYAIGMLALAGFPIFFSGFWSKDEILHAAWIWPVSKIPFLLGIFGALLTAFYMTRQVCYVFFGESRLPVAKASAEPGHGHAHGTVASSLESPVAVHESPPVMTYPLVILAVFAMALGIVGTPAWPWFHGFLTGHEAHFDISKLMSALPLLLLSAVIVFSGLGLGYFLYGRKPIPSPEAPDVLEQKQPALFRVLQNKFYVDELYDATVVRFQHGSAWLSDILDRLIWNGAVHLIAGLVLIVSWISRLLDEFVVNWGFDRGCGFLRGGGQGLSQLQTGQVHHYLRIIGISLTLLILLLTWGFTRS
ncbi:MAG: NADH-quinone oxidoreductase subunit L, partial [Verrucomicrobiota bacterium]